MRIRILFLQFCVFIAFLIDMALSIFAFWPLTGRLITIYRNAQTAILAGTGLYFAAVVFAIACWTGWQLLRTIQQQKAFSQRAVDLLRRLKWSVSAFACGLMVTLPQMYVVTQSEDAPGLILITCTIIMVPVVVAVFLAILQRLWQSALDYKTDSDLTV